ncbi:hypothetical protein BH10BAC2_BH10BAC2_14320 [soil metagenome]
MKLTIRLLKDIKYQFEDIDANKITTINGNEFELPLAPNQNSAIFFISVQN